MALSLALAGPPPPHRYCPSSLVRKPVRSKYCVRRRCVVARFDHFCGWLNTTIGFRNHRTFVVFLVSHLLLAMAFPAMIIR
ncbi:DHHC palmitoyltransferase-domain-containing protein [Ochromonadaceae sp. CCMP2298]|nr:DHHC palmitoyltransferase-domain-containing protein [Ochromonadaceae sp. CCMP2298]